MPMLITHFITDADVPTLLAEEFSPRSYTHQMFILDYFLIYPCDVAEVLSSLRSLDDGGVAEDNRYEAFKLARCASWQGVERVGCSAQTLTEIS